MPLKSTPKEAGNYNEKVSSTGVPYNVLVARIMNKKKIATSDGAKTALQLEWDKLKQQGMWDVERVKPWHVVAAAAKDAKKTVHVGRIFEICVEQKCELPTSDVRRKFKRRVVFQGNQVKDENFEAAKFQEMGSAPATMGASKSCDFDSLLPGHRGQQSDAESAYMQSRLSSHVVAWVCIPRHQWPKDGLWEGIVDLVCPSILALYGCPDTGGYWEKHCDTILRSCDFEAVANWTSCYFRPLLKLFMIVYVHDIKMSGPVESMKKGGPHQALDQDRWPCRL
jgi:hypothetical protein